MTINESLKFFRKHRKINQNAMSVKMDFNDRSNYSKIETGKIKVPSEFFEPFADTLSITVSELILFSDFDSDLKLFEETVKKGFADPTNPLVKRAILDYYLPLKKNKAMTNKQLALYYTLVANFSATYTEISDFSESEIQYSFSHLKKLSYYTQYDYLLAYNMTIYYSPEQIDTLFNKMFPITDKDKRTVTTLKYVNGFVLNVITKQIYNLQYDMVLEYIKKAETEILDFQNHYYRFIMSYYKNLVLYLEKENTGFLNMAEMYLKVIKDMGPKDVYINYYTEYQNLVKNPRFYMDSLTHEIITNT